MFILCAFDFILHFREFAFLKSTYYYTKFKDSETNSSTAAATLHIYINLFGGRKLTLNLLTSTVVVPSSNASKWRMGFNSAFKGLNRASVTIFGVVILISTSINFVD